ncbi:MAG: tetratricopeptide repeat protein [Alphaproteobacteria bacterium]|nr:tetratricopeptide repeat protein [Alphaproteobacteria bacterium]
MKRYGRARQLVQGLARCVALGAALVPLAARAQHLPAVESDHYERCMNEARQNPSAAWDDALAWRDTGGGHPAEHCAAVALIGLKQYAEAARRLEKLADEMSKAPVDLRTEVLSQAAQAWLLNGNAPQAAEVDTLALKLAPDDPDILTDRAEALAAQSKFKEAVADLDHALARDPNRVDALIYRASAKRQLDQLDPALRDVEAALRLQPDEPDALLERGNIRRLKGDDAGARKDWLRVALVAPNTAADTAAKDNLEKMDVKTDGAAPAPPAKKKKG